MSEAENHETTEADARGDTERFDCGKLRWFSQGAHVVRLRSLRVT